MKKFLLSMSLFVFTQLIWASNPSFIASVNACTNTGKIQSQFRLKIDVNAPFVSVDDCSDAAITTLIVGSSDMGSTIGATSSSFPIPMGTMGSAVDVWYSYLSSTTATHLSLTYVTTPVSDPTPGAIIQLWSSPCDDTGSPVGTLLQSTAANPGGVRCVAIMPSTQYYIRIINELGQETNFDITLLEPSVTPATITSTVGDFEFCSGDPVSLTATPNTPGFAYNWSVLPALTSPSTNASNPFTGTAPVVAAITAVTANVTITDNGGCTSTATQIININPLPSVTIVETDISGIAPNDNNVCVGAAFTLTADPGFATYAWALGATVLPSQTTNVLTVPSSVLADGGIYSVTVTDVLGCPNVDDININVIANPLVNNTTLQVCSNGAASGSFTLNHAELAPDLMFPIDPSTNSNILLEVDNGVAGVTVTYHETTADAMADINALVSPYVPASTPATVFARVKSNVTGCYTIADVLLTTPAAYAVQIQNVNNANATTDFEVCQGSEIELGVDEGSTVTPYSYTWDIDGTTYGGAFPLASAVMATHDGVWTVTVTDGNGCTATDNITITVTPNPANDLCAGALPVVLGANASLTNECATQDLVPCSAPQNEASVWYSYTIPDGLETIVISTSDITGAGLAVYESNCTTLIQGGCTGSVMIDCPEGGDIRIMVTTSGADMDDNFTLTITETVQTGKDICSGAVDLVLAADVCVASNTFNDDNIDMCPELASLNFGGCDFTTGPASWYKFTTDATTDFVDIEITGLASHFGVFSACGGAGLSGSCTTDGTMVDLAVTGATTYFLVVAGTAGANGAFVVNISEKTNPPANDLCANAAAVNLGANATTNLCATDDLTPCAGALNQASVWYSYTIPVNVETLIITSDLSGGAISLFEDNCTTPYIGSQTGNCTNTVNLECPQDKIIKIFVSSATVNADDFSITLTQTLQTGVDLCSGAEILLLTEPLCGDPNDFMKDNTGFCPDPASINFGGCDFADGPATWYTFTTGANTDLLDIAITGLATDFGLFSSCAGASVGGSCTTDGTLADQTVTGNTQYWLLVSGQSGAEGPFTINITEKANPPANSMCADAVGLTDNMPVNGTTACAPAWTVAYCALNTTTSHTVFYNYTVPATNTTNVDLIFTVTPNTATSGTAANTNVNIGLFTNCTGTVFTANVVSGNFCSALSGPITISCVAPGTVITIAIGSADGNEGDFSINVNESNTGFPPNDLCAEAEVITFTASCDFVNVDGTTVNACPESFAGNCDLINFPTVFFEATVPAGGVGFTFDNLVGNPNISVLSNSCAAPVSFGACITAATSITTLAPGTYLIAVRTNNMGGVFSFDIKTIVPPVNSLCTNAVSLTDNAPANGTTSCATPFTTSYCSLNTTTSHTVFYTYTVPASNTTNTNLDVTLTPNTSTTGTAATNDLNVGLFVGCAGTVYDASISSGMPCTALGNAFTIECVAPGTVITFAVGSSDGDEGDFSITVDEDNVGIPSNDLCSNPLTINITNNCISQTVNGTTVDACPDINAECGFDNFPTVWYEVVLPAQGIGFGFDNLSAGLNIGVYNNACPATTINGACVTGMTSITTLTPGTYLLAVRNTDPGAVFNFDIKTLLFLPNDEPCNPGFISTPLSSGGALANQDNLCATDDRMCGAATVENSLWYNFTLSAGFDRITISVTGLTDPSIALYPAGNPCSTTVINSECNGDGMVDFNCLPPGTYQIFVGTAAADAGIFTITATEGNNAGPANDFCAMATPITISPSDLCINLPFESTNVNACPETGLTVFGTCDFNTEETSWYTFTAPGVAGDAPTMDFTFTGYTGTGSPFMNLFTGPCGNLAPVETQCFQGVGTVFGNIGPLTPGTQYWIAIASAGDTGGDFDFTVKFNLGPLNDDKCHTASGFDLGSSGNNLGVFTNECAGGDYIITTCPATSSENSVWFTFTVDPGSYGVTLLVDVDETNSNPIEGPIAYGVFEDGCGSGVAVLTDCSPVKTLMMFECLEPGTYDLQISTSTLTAGDFIIDISQLVDNRMCPSGVLTDLCEDAIVIPMAGVFCTPVSTASCNTNACPEDFFFGACSYGDDPTVWFEFTVDNNAASIDIINMTAGFYYSILTGDPCNDAVPTALAPGCSTTPNLLNVAITGGQTYYLIVANPTDGPFSFSIIQNVFPENDDPDPSSPRPPHVLSVGGSHESSTCCALGLNDGPGLDIANASCSPSSEDGAVWYRYTTGAEDGFEVTVTPVGAGGITGPTTIEILSGSATAPGTALFNPTSVSCGPAPVTIKVGCYDAGEEVWIKVASANGDCGSFTITLEEIMRCDLAELCPDATDVIVTNPTDVDCGDFTPVTVRGCLDAACPETEVGICGFNMGPVVWFQVMIDAEAVQLGTSISTEGTWQPVWAIFSGGCGSLVPLSGSGPNDPPVNCSNADSNPDIHTVGVTTGIQTYWIAVTADGLVDNPEFTLNVWTSALCVACIGEDGCVATANWSITSRSSPRALDDPLFCQGEDVTVCVDYLYDASETGVDWLHGLIPSFGAGWDLEAFDPAAVTVSPSNGLAWNDEDDGACAPRITERMPYLCTYPDPVTGKLKLCHTGCQVCPCSGPLDDNSPLPSGWFWSTNGGAGCLNDCSPATHYGIGSVVVQISFCVELKVRVFDTDAECIQNRSLEFSFQTTSDGVSGCWNDPVAECKLDFAQIGPDWNIDCDRPPKVLGNDQAFCVEGMVDILLTNLAGSSDVTIEVMVIDNPNVTGENNHNFPGGTGTINDYLINTGSNIEIVEYICRSTNAMFICPSPSDTFRVTLYPQVVVDIDDESICYGDLNPITLSPNVSGGTGNYVGTSIPFAPGYFWSTGATTTTIDVSDLFASQTFFVTVTDDFGCSGTGQADIEVKPPVSFIFEPDVLNLCGGDDEVVSIQDIVANSNNVQILWNIPTGLSAIGSGEYLNINPGASNPLFSPYTVSATIIDAFGCNVTNMMTVYVSDPPQATLTPEIIACGVTISDFTVDGFYNTSGNMVKLTLLDCQGNIVETIGGNPIFSTADGQSVFDGFYDVNLLVQNCFVLKMESIDPVTNETLCEVLLDDLVVPLTSGTPIVMTPASKICLNESINIGITSTTAATTTFAWSPAGLPATKTISVSPITTTQYTVTATQANGCTRVGNVVVTVNDLPTAGITGSTTYCPNASTEMTANGGTSYAWSGPAGFTASTANTGPINVNGGLYTVTITDVNGCEDTESVTISESNQLIVTIADLVLCDNMVDTLDAGSGFDTYQWTNSANVSIGNVQKVGVAAAGMYTVSVSKGSCLGSGMADVINNVTPSTNIPDTIKVCRLAIGTGENPTSVNFNSFTTGIPGTWINSSGISVNTADWSSIDFTSTTMAGEFYFNFVTSNAISPCIDVMDSILVQIENCVCPTPSISFSSVCNDRSLLLDLDNGFVNASFPINYPGSWAFVAGTTPYPTITNDSLNIFSATPGSYTLRYTIGEAFGTCPLQFDAIININPASSVTGIDAVLCNQNIGSGPTSVNLSTLLSNLVEPAPGSWTLDGVPVTNTLIDAMGSNPDTLTFVYTTTATAPCNPEKAEVNIRIRNCLCPEISLAPDTLCNGSMVLLDLENPSRFTASPSTVTGTWTASAPLVITNDKFINPSGVQSSTNYTATFAIAGNLPSECQREFTKTVIIRDQPVGVKRADPNACNIATGNGPTVVNLFSQLQAGYTTGGNWTQISPATPVLPVTSGNVDFVNQVVGGQFVYRYSLGTQDPCSDVAIDIKVTIVDCNCPNGDIACPNATDGCDLCNDNDILDISTFIVDPTLFTAGGVWKVTGPSAVDIPLINGTILDAKNLPQGKYIIRYTLDPPPSGSCPKFDQDTIIISKKQIANITTDTLLCNGMTGVQQFQLSLLNPSEDVGTWRDANGVPVVQPYTIDISGKPQGAMMNFTFTVTNQAPCENTVYPVVLNITNNCNCPPIILGSLPPLCSNLGTYDLKPISAGTAFPGRWISSNTAITITAGVLQLTGLQPGLYTLRYELIGAPVECDQFKDINFTVSEPKTAGTARGANFCLGATDVVNLFDRLDDEDTGGLWTVTSGGTAGFNAATGSFALTGRPAGTYVFKYAFIQQSPCPDDAEEITINIYPLPIADAGTDKKIDCDVQNATLGTSNTSTGVNIVYEWKLANTIVSTDRTFTTTNGGSYVLTVKDTVTECSASDIVVVDKDTNIPEFDVAVDTIACFDQVGKIVISNIRNGKAPYQISFDGGTTYGDKTTLDNLKTGTFKIRIKDGNGCVVTYPDISITEPPVFVVKLVDDFELILENDSLLSIVGQYDPLTAQSVTWKANGVEIPSAKDKGTYLAKPEIPTTYTVTVINESGCIATDNLNITIKRLKPDCVPNVFTPNGNDGNQFFSINCTRDVELVTKYSIYDRWGNLLFVGKDLSPSQPETFWDGKFKGKFVVPGVYVYSLELLFKDGSKEAVAGDVTVIDPSE